MGDARPLLDEELHDLVRDAVADVSSAARSLDLGADRLAGPGGADRERRARPQATILPLAPPPPPSRPQAFLARLEVRSTFPTVRHPVRTRRVAVACHRASPLDVRRASRMLRIAVPVVALGPPTLAPGPAWVTAIAEPSPTPADSAPPAAVQVSTPPAPVQPAGASVAVVPAQPPRPAAEAPTAIWRAASGHAANLAIAAALELVAIFCAIMVGLVVTGHHLEQVVTGSMQPSIPIGSLVLTERIPVSRLHVGDIMVFPNPSNPKETIVHRIVWLSHDSQGDVLVRTKGDYNALPDSWTLSRAASADADKVTLIIPGAGTLAAWLQTVGIWGLVVLVAGAVGWYGVRRARSILAEDDPDEQPAPAGGGT
jgi:signal peptidase I